MSDSFYIAFKRLVYSIYSQWLLILFFFIGYYWTNHILPQKIWEYFGLLRLQETSLPTDQTMDFLRAISSFPDFQTMASYLSELFGQATTWGYLNLTLIFAKITRFAAVGICNILLLYLLFNIVMNVFKTYKQKTTIAKTVHLVVKALEPQLTCLEMEVRSLRSEIKMLKNELHS